MAVDSTTRRVVYAGNGKTTAFPFAFKVFNATDVSAAVGANTEGSTDLAYGTDYTVALNSDQETNPGGTVTVTTAPATGYNLAITSSVPYDQPMKLTPYDGFNPETLNDNSDRQCVQIQQIKEKLDRAVVVDATDTMTPAELKQELRNAAETAYEVASGYANQAKQSAEAAKASEQKTATYADAALVVSPVAGEVKTVAGIASDVTSVAGVAQDVKKVAGITTAVSNVANIATETQAVGSNIATITRANSLLSHTADLTKLSPHIGDLHRVGQDLLASDKKDMSYDFGMVSDVVETVSTVTGGILKSVADHLDDCIHPVGQKIDVVHDVAQNLATISRATGLLDHTADIAALSPHIDDLHRVGQDLLVTDAVDKSYDYGSVSDAVEPSGTVTGGILKNVSDHIKDCIHPVAQKLDDIHTVGTVATEVTKVASIAAEVKLASEVESHITDIQAAQEHIDEIHAVGQDLQGISDPSLDYGAVTEDAHPIATIIGGYIKAVAEHIEDCIHPLSLELSTVEIVAKNIDSVVKAKELLEDHKADPEGHPVATQSTAGFMSAADKTKLDGTEQFVDGSVTAAKLADTIDLGGF